MIEKENDYYLSRVKIQTHAQLIAAIIEQALADLKIPEYRKINSYSTKSKISTRQIDRESAIDFLMNDNILLKRYLELFPYMNVKKTMSALKKKAARILEEQKKKEEERLKRKMKNAKN